MGKDINLNSEEWCDVVFKGRNKQYGAYRLRQTSTKRYIIAFIAVILMVVVICFIPGLINAVNSLKGPSELGPIDESYTMTDVENQVPEENIIKQETAPPPPPLKSTVKFTPPVIAKDEEVAEEQEMKAVEEVLESNLQVSVADIQGTDEESGLDIAELEQHKVIVEEKVEEKPYQTVEQMPVFPGGEIEMQKFVANSLRYPIAAQENGTQGRVTIRFVVTPTGDISNVEVLRGIDPLCDKEAVRVVKSMPKWIPGKQNGRNVSVYFTLPIVFRLQN